MPREDEAMTRTLMIGVIFALGPAMASPSIGQDSAAGAPNGRSPARHVDRQPAKPEFKVAFWYRRAEPSGSLRSQVYDLRRGQYDRGAVEGWLKRMKTDFPAYVALERDINLDSEPGAIEEAKLAAAIDREHAQIVGAHAPQVKRGPVRPNQPSEALREGRASRSPSEYRPMDLSRLLHPGGKASVGSFTGGNGFGRSTFGGAPGSGGSSPSPSSHPFPNPYPYPRPHP